MFGTFNLFSDIDVHDREIEVDDRGVDFLTSIGSSSSSSSSSSCSPPPASRDVLRGKEENAEDLENRLFNILFQPQSNDRDTDGTEFDANVDFGDTYEDPNEFEHLVRTITPLVKSPSETSRSGRSRPRKRSSVIAALDEDKISSPLPNPIRRKSSIASLEDNEDYSSLLSPSILEGTSNLQLSSPAPRDEEEEEEKVEQTKTKKKKKIFKERTIVVSENPETRSAKRGARRKHVRGSYRCRLCGLPKKNHKCVFAPKVKPRKKKREKQKSTVACQASLDSTMTVAYLNISRAQPQTEIPTMTFFEPCPRPLLDEAKVSSGETICAV